MHNIWLFPCESFGISFRRSRVCSPLPVRRRVCSSSFNTRPQIHLPGWQWAPVLVWMHGCRQQLDLNAPNSSRSILILWLDVHRRYMPYGSVEPPHGRPHLFTSLPGGKVRCIFSLIESHSLELFFSQIVVLPFLDRFFLNLLGLCLSTWLCRVGCINCSVCIHTLGYLL